MRSPTRTFDEGLKRRVDVCPLVFIHGFKGSVLSDSKELSNAR